MGYTGIANFLTVAHGVPYRFYGRAPTPLAPPSDRNGWMIQNTFRRTVTGDESELETRLGPGDEPWFD